MILFLNGKFVPEEQAVVSVFDRSFLYGDGLFETMLFVKGVPFRWAQHLERLERGAKFLGISTPFAAVELKTAARELIVQNRMQEGLLRLTLSRGVGIRGYSPRGANSPTLVMSLHPSTDPKLETLRDWHLKTATFRLPANEPLAQFKNCNKLVQVMARAEADRAGADEALLTNTDGFVVEGASSNLFWIEEDAVLTPPLSSGVLSGVTRLLVIEICKKLGLEARQKNIARNDFFGAGGVFLSLSSFGVVQGLTLDGRPLNQSPLTPRIHAACVATVRSEVAQAAS